MSAQLDKLQAEADLFRRQMRWEPWKALAAILGGVAAMSGVILAVAHFLPQPQAQPPIIIQLPAQAAPK